MSGGGGKGGSKKTETTIPEWVRAPADRNLQRAEAVQQIKYMPYTGGQVAALTPTQEAAMNNNISTAQAFGLLDPNSTLTATSGMPEPTTYDNGMRGYGSIGLYDQALAELTARDPANMAAYNNLFGNAIPANVARSSGGGRGGGGGSTPNRQPTQAEVMANRYANTKVGEVDGVPLYGYTGQGSQGRAGTMTLGKVSSPLAQERSRITRNRNIAQSGRSGNYGSGKKFGGNY